MRQSLLTVLVIVCMATGPSASQDQPAPKEENCRNAIEAGLEQLRRTPPDLNSRDDEDRRKLLPIWNDWWRRTGVQVSANAGPGPK